MSASQRTAFVIMPIGPFGSEESTYFRTLYEEWIKTTLEECGYKAFRADEIQESGAITQDIIMALSTADLVVCDLTTLNPNVFYELGVRHTLRGQGTVMILDEARTPNIPFDLTAYRVLKFTSDLVGIGRLRTDLRAFAKALLSRESAKRDNPVHDWLPALPLNAVDAATGSEETRLRQEAASLRKLIQQYEERFGVLRTQTEIDDSPNTVIAATLLAARDGMTVPALLDKAHQAVLKRNVISFLEAVQKLLSRVPSGLKARDIIELATEALQLDLDEVAGAIFRLGVDSYPEDDALALAHLAHLAHSSAPDDREQARRGLAERADVRVDSSGEVTPPNDFPNDARKRGAWMMMLDAYHRDGLDDEALHIAEAFYEKFPRECSTVRIYARALGKVGRMEECLKFHREAILCPAPDDTSATWYGNELHNRGRRVDAVEAYCVACLIDPQDGKLFSRLAEEVSDALLEKASASYRPIEARLLPDSVDQDSVRNLIAASLSCETLSEDALRECRSAATQAGLYDIDVLSEVTRARREEFRLQVSQRVRIISDLYSSLKSEITVGTVAVTPAIRRGTTEMEAD